MDWKTIAGRALMVGVPAPDLDEDVRSSIEEIGPGGVILFRRNLDTVERLTVLQEALAASLPDPRLIAVDQEGGRVSRIEPWIGPTPGGVEVATRGGRPAYLFGQATGAALRALGFNVDFAPVVDLSRPEASNGIGDRSYGTDPEKVTGIAGSFLDGLQRAGVAGCLKHFPGLGETAVDSHERLPVCAADRTLLEERDLRPFARLGPRAAMVMVGHAYYPALEDETGTPASLSRAIVTGILRLGLGYPGLVVSDDMEMGAVSPLDREGRAAVLAVAAGCDLLIYGSDLDRARAARDALAAAAKLDRAFAERLDEAAAAVRRTAARWPVSRADVTVWKSARRRLLDASRAS
jgi:beta-N-acetylhexosaminidase